MIEEQCQEIHAFLKFGNESLHNKMQFRQSAGKLKWEETCELKRLSHVVASFFVCDCITSLKCTAQMLICIVQNILSIFLSLVNLALRSNTIINSTFNTCSKKFFSCNSFCVGGWLNFSLIKRA